MHKNKPKFALSAIGAFVLVVTAIMTEANLIVLKSLISIFNLNPLGQIILNTTLITLSAGFLVVLIVERFSTNFLVKIFYSITSTWTGVFLYILMASVLYDISFLFLSEPRTLGLVLVIAAATLGIYGVINGDKILIKKIEVKIPNLPENWRGRTALWMSDLHLGVTRKESFTRKVTAMANSLTPDVVFIGGDLYDGTRAIDAKSVIAPLADLKSKYGTFFITGNHEEFESPEIFLKAIKEIGITVINDEKVELDGIQIVGVDYKNNVNKEDFKNNLLKINIDKNKPSILLKHEPAELPTAEEAGIGMQISGHTHNGQQWPFNLLAKKIYKGYAYGLKTHGSMQVYTSSGTACWGPTLRVGSNREIVLIKFI